MRSHKQGYFNLHSFVYCNLYFSIFQAEGRYTYFVPSSTLRNKMFGNFLGSTLDFIVTVLARM
jgi:hypothetical protein